MTSWPSPGSKPATLIVSYPGLKEVTSLVDMGTLTRSASTLSDRFDTASSLLDCLKLPHNFARTETIVLRRTSSSSALINSLSDVNSINICFVKKSLMLRASAIRNRANFSVIEIPRH